MSYIIIIILLIIIIGLVKSKNTNVESLGNTGSSRKNTYTNSLTAVETITIEPYQGPTKLKAIKTIREVNQVIGLKEAKMLIEQGGSLELYVPEADIEVAKNQLRTAGIVF